MEDKSVKACTYGHDIVADFLEEAQKPNICPQSVQDSCPQLLAKGLQVILRTGEEKHALPQETIVASPWVPFYQESFGPRQVCEELGDIQLEASIACPSHRLSIASMNNITLQLIARSSISTEQQSIMATVHTDNLELRRRDGKFFKAEDEDLDYMNAMVDNIKDVLLPRNEALDREKRQDLEADARRKRIALVDTRGNYR